MADFTSSGAVRKLNFRTDHPVDRHTHIRVHLHVPSLWWKPVCKPVCKLIDQQTASHMYAKEDDVTIRDAMQHLMSQTENELSDTHPPSLY
jgi:hypothetical protein